ncbi:MAG: BatA domain-containing protein [Planctomycetaceae bacterium]
MSFIQPAMLFALPLIALPILIHLINQNRYKTMPWGATMFLLKAKRMARGMARLRYLLLMLARMLAVAGLIFAISRPMAGGWLGLTSSNAPEVTIVVLDRSVSMEEQNPQTSQSKRSTALRKLSELVQKTESGTRLVLFDSALQQPLEISSVQELETLPEAGATSTSTDMPALMQKVAEYIETNESGRTDIWVCSDLRQNDWNPTAGRWEAVRQQLSVREGVRLFLLTYPDVADDNLAITVSGAHRRESLDGAELVMDLALTRATPADEPQQVDLTFVIDGARSRETLELTGRELIRKGHAIPLDKDAKEGWGRVELPRDSNLQDNIFRFVYAEPAVRKTVIVSDDEAAAEMFRIAAATAADRSLIYEAEILPTASANAIPWGQTAMIVWQAPIPDGLVAKQLENFVLSGRSVMFFPPESPGDNNIFNAAWTEWRTPEEGDHFPFKPWRTDSDLLANANSGAPLPVGQVQCYRACHLDVKLATSLWQLENGMPLLARAGTDRGAAYFCSTLPTTSSSNLISNGITFYVMTQRALARGAGALGRARQLSSGKVLAAVTENWTALDELSIDNYVSQRSLAAGLYRSDEQLLAINRPLEEDNAPVISNEALGQVLAGLEYTRIDDKVGAAMQLASEVWRTFLMLMIAALIAEALLCVPDKGTGA